MDRRDRWRQGEGATAINAAFSAIGTMPAEGATAQFLREREELNWVEGDDPTVMSEITKRQRKAGNVWLGVERMAVAALGRDPGRDRLPDSEYAVEPWVSDALAKMEKAKSLSRHTITDV